MVPPYHYCTTNAVAMNITSFNPLCPHDALKHHFTSLKTDLIFIQEILNENFHETGLPTHGNFL